MMDRYSKSQLARNFNRSNDIDVSAEFKQKLEDRAIMHLSAGNMTEYMVCMSTLGKIDTVNQLNTKIDDTNATVAKLVEALGSADKTE
jgi:hypothetical protein